MIVKSLFPEVLQSFEYYKNKLPLWLQQTYGFITHFKIWHEFLMGIRTDLEGEVPEKTYYVSGDLNEEIVIDDFPFETNVGEPNLYGEVRIGDLNIQYSPFRISALNACDGALTLSNGLQTVAVRFCFGMPEQYMGVLPSADCILYLLGIYDKNYLKTINNLLDEDYEVSDSKSDMLDKIGKLFGLNRKVKVTYDNAGVPTTEYLNLNNEEFLMLIKAQIIKNYWDGTLETLKSFYEDIGLYCHIYTNAAFSDTVEHPDEPTAKASFVLINPSHEPHSDNIIKMFKGGLLRTESMGVMYEDTVVSSGTFGIWDTADWDLGVWFI